MLSCKGAKLLRDVDVANQSIFIVKYSCQNTAWISEIKVYN